MAGQLAGGRRRVLFAAVMLAALASASLTGAALRPVQAQGNTWTTKADMPTPRQNLAAAVIDGKLYVVGGIPTTISSKLEVYDPQTDTWTTQADMPTARSSLGAAVIDGKLYAVGGGISGFTNKLEVFEPPPPNTAPEASDDAYGTDEDTALTVSAPGVLSNDTDAEMDALTATLVTNPANGTLTFNPDGSFTYTPAANFNGADSFTYKASDGSPESNTATVRITVNAVNDVPTINGATISRQQAALGTASTIATAADAETAPGSLTVTVTSVPAGIAVTNIVNTDGAITADVVAACTAALGAHTVGLRVTDGGGLTATASLTVTVTASNAPAINLKPAVSLWPPNRSYHTLTVGQMVAGATDDCDGDLAAGVRIERVTSDEPDNAPGDADGNTTQDIVIGADCKSVQLRAERDERKNGRVYTVTLRVRDTSGNTTRAEYKVSVPIGQSSPAVQDATAQTRTSTCP